MTAEEYLSKQDGDRKELLTRIHSIILQADSTVTASVGTMMGKEMLLYKEKDYFKYGLAAVKNYMTMHIMPIYGGSPLHAKYRELLPHAEFQKGCINFRDATAVPSHIIRALFVDCAKVSIAAILEQRSRSGKAGQV